MIDIVRQYWQNYLYTDGFQFTGLAVTLWLLVASLGLGFMSALPLAVARASRNRFLSTPVWLFTYVFRGTPLYVQLLICYTGLYSLHVVHSHALLDAFFRDAMNCTLLAFALNECAYATEIFAGSIKATAYGEIEAAIAVGMSRFTVYRRIILPSALRRALPMYGNEAILMLHSTTLAFTATIPDILKVTRDVNSATYASFEAFGIAALLYAMIAFALVWMFRQLERRLLAYLKPRSG
ncbi:MULTISPECIES: ABC transporter permease [Paraburkholderia]|jgi:histidine transport system permease protein|uniref:Histidine/lysine/arginine/ornithine transport system permease protein HisM n=1 Tax=Paraburkholderia madseniana TaxID=2599607 RepID=A0A6N6WMC8_9BURK|nr:MULTISPECIES: ABC transporter permease [Paraburkholderia]KAE8761209.1 ABC transporter permease subunit [Paraburkholderia madseniana]MCX4174104.1 ABC transporter permease [Paraburkholderia madseniana]MDQ6462107.1 ABC transporter permease [Paraburkholderia madseniana]NPT67290.1 ABC transporter permease subunit [Paraburkholderia madseniana]